GETHHYYDWCLGSGCYTFTIYDSESNGLGFLYPDPGYATITNLETSEVYGTVEDDFGEEASIAFCLYVPTLSVDPYVLNFGGVTAGESAVMSYILTGENLTDTVFIYSPSNNFEVSFNSSSGFNSALNIPFDTENLNDTIYVKFLPDNETTYNDYISNTSSNAEAYVNVTGNGSSNIESNTNRFFSVYPNPSSGVVYVESDQLKYIEITDNTGRTLAKQNVHENKTRIDLSEFATGIYLLSLTDVNDNMHYAKIQLSK
ncbi:MAG: T9SS type A sorting domain-containing protein, partial [Bacteroidota bacterium]|nr:T9SS type A sorting domain-containing protein [Bacteroidota bacterium]